MFGDKLKELRYLNGYTMDELVKIYNSRFNAKMNKSTLSRYENNLQAPMFSVVANMSKLFGVSVDFLAGNNDETIQLTPHEKEVVTQYRAKPHLQEAIDKLLDISPREDAPLAYGAIAAEGGKENRIGKKKPKTT